MSRSFSQPLEVSCPECDYFFLYKAWLIVDIIERPDLASRIREGVIHMVSCPHCGCESDADVPLLVHDSKRRRVLFALPSRTTREQDRQIADELLSRLSKAFVLRPRYLRQPIAVPRELLPQLLDADDPRAILEKIADERAMAQLPSLLKTLQEFLSSDIGFESRRFLKKHPELLSAEVDSFLVKLTDDAQRQGHEEARRIFEKHRVLLRRCREVGIAEAFDEMGVFDDGPLPEYFSSSFPIHRINSILDLKPIKFLEFVGRLPSKRQEVIREVMAQAHATGRSEEEIWALIDAHPEVQGFLREIELSMMETALESVIPDSRPSNELETLVNKLRFLARPEDMTYRAILCKRALVSVKQEEDPEMWAYLHAELGTSLCNDPQGDTAGSIVQGIHHYKQALQVYSSESHPENWGRLHHELGRAHMELNAVSHWQQIRHDILNPTGDVGSESAQSENVELAIHHYEKALEVLTQESHPNGWASTLTNLANAYQVRTQGDQAENLEKAMRHYLSALRVYKE